MRRITLYFSLALISLASFSQDFVADKRIKTLKENEVPFYRWSSEAEFVLSPTPGINNITQTADSLTQVLGYQVYEHESVFYPIRSWADYYYWFTQRYWYRFSSNVLAYAHFYFSGDDSGMAAFISDKFSGDFYPISCDLRIYNSDKGEFLQVIKYNEKYTKEAFEIENEKYKKKGERELTKWNPSKTNNRVDLNKFSGRKSNNPSATNHFIKFRQPNTSSKTSSMSSRKKKKIR